MDIRRALAWAFCIGVACGPRSIDSRLSEQDDEGQRRAWEAARAGGPRAPDYLAAKRGYLKQVRRDAGRSGALVAAGMARWSNLGPFDAAVDPWIDSGRLRTIVTHPTDSRIIYLGTAGGGVWKTSNADLTPGSTWTWTPITDGIAPASASGNIAVGSLAMSPADPETLYLALGDPGGGSGGARGFFITRDGGATWSEGGDPGHTDFVYTILPIGASVVLVGGSDGLWRSSDGGRSFRRIAFAGSSGQGEFIFSLARFADGTLLCARLGSGGIERSTDDGQTWTVASLPQNPRLSRITLATSGRTAFALAADGLDRLQSGVFKSIDQGKSWVWIPSDATLFPDRQGGYNQMLAVDPDDPSRLLAGGIYPMRSQDGGLHWERLQSIMHSDLQTAAWSRMGTKALFIGHDGGLTLLRDPWGPPGPGFADSTHNRGLATHLVYQLSGTTAPTPPDARDRVAIGLQDNGCRERHGAPLAQSGRFDQQMGGDGYGVLYHPLDGRKLLCGTNGWIFLVLDGVFSAPVFQNAEFYPPLFADVSDPSGDSAFTLSADGVVKTTDFGRTWTALPTTGIPAGSNPYAFASSRAPGGPLMIVTVGRGYRSVDGGTTWTAFSSPTDGWVTGLAFGDQTLYAWSNILDTRRPHAWRSHDLGDTWQPIDGNGLPPLPVYQLVPDRKDPSVLWAATDVGVYRSADGGAAWTRFGVGLPWVTVRDLYVAADGSLVRAGTFGRGVWEARLDGLPPPPTPIALAMAPLAQTIAAGSSGSFLVTASSPPGAAADAFALSVAGLPPGVTASFAPGSIAPGGRATLTVLAARTAPVATLHLTVAGGGATPAGDLSIAPAPPDDFSVSLSREGVVLAPGGSALVQVGTLVVSGLTQPIALSAEGVPAGVTASFDPALVSAGGGSVLTLRAAAGAAATTATCRVRASSATAVHTAALGVAVAPPPQAGPVVAVSAPADGATVAGLVRLVATASAQVGLAHLELLVDGVIVASSSSSPLETSWDARATPPGSHAITAAATDQLGQRAVAAKVSVVVAAAEQVPPGGGRAGGGCSSAPGTLDGALAALLLALGSRRRRAA
jgi:photosystem II stability/assembly factor-like uncharacterized protein